MVRRTPIILVVLLFCLSGGAFAYDFWGITMGTEAYKGATQLTFTAPPSGPSDPYVGYEVGGYSYTKVGSTWYGGATGFPAASPGAAYPTLQRQCDAMGLFFMPTANAARFRIITGMPDTGVTATSVGYGNRQFGPGDLKLDVTDSVTHDVTTYGVGFREGGLLWAQQPGSTAPWYQVYNPAMQKISMTARDAGTFGTIVENPNWGHVDNHTMTAYDPHGSAFFISGTGTQTGSADAINIEATGIFLNGVQLYSYEAVVPWAALGITTSVFDVEASWRPDCGNDLIYKRFNGSKPDMSVPEPFSVMLAAMGLSAVGLYRRRR